MAYLIYRTDFANTIVGESTTDTASGGTEQSILKSLISPTFLIPETQPIYYWKIVLPTSAIPNDEIHIALWEKKIAIPPTADALATVGYVTGLTSVINNNINYISGVTDTKLDISTYTGYTTTTGLQQVTDINASTTNESTFRGGLITNKIRPTGDTTTAIQIHKADGITNIINVDTVSGFTGYGTIAPKNKVHLFGTDTTDTSECAVQTNGLTLDGVAGADKEIVWANNGVPKWQAQTCRNENDVFWYLANTQSKNNPLTVMETGGIGINKQSNYANYHAAEIVTVTGLDDLVVSGIYTQNYNTVYELEIVASGVTFDTWHWRKSVDASITYGGYSPSSGATLTPVELENGIFVNFKHLTGHGAGAKWRFVGFSQIPQATLTLAPMEIQEVQKTNNYFANPIIYKDITAVANGGVYENQFEIFSSGSGGTSQSIYFGFTVQAQMMFINLATYGSDVTLVAQYWNTNISDWTTLSTIHDYIDGTNNLENSGRIIWQPQNMTGWDKGYIPDLVETNYDLYWIRLITTTNPAIAPIAKSINIGNDKRFAIYDSFNDYRPSYYVDTLGRVNIGGGNITGKNTLQINSATNTLASCGVTESLFEIDSENSSVTDMKLKLSSNDNCGAGITFIGTRGTLDTPASTQYGDTLGRIDFKGRFNNCSEILSRINSVYTGVGGDKEGDLVLSTADNNILNEVVRISSTGTTGFGISTPTAIVHLKEGTTSIAPLRFNSGNLLSSPQAGAVEFNNDAYYGTITSGSTRKTFAFLESPIFTGTPQLPIGTCLIPVSANLNDYIWNSGGTNNACLFKTCSFNAYTGNTQPTINIAITGASNGLTKSGSHDIKFGGLLTEDTTVGAGGKNFTLCAKKFTIASHSGTDIYDALGNDINIYSSGGTVTLYGKTSGGTEAMRFIINQSQATFTDSRVIPKGIEYDQNYAGTFVARSLVDKGYVDSVATGLVVKTSVQVATTANVSLSGLTTVDSIILTNGTRVLVKDQNTGSQNGIYIATGATWHRAVDYDFSPAGEISNGNLIPIVTGTTNGNTIWVLTTPDPIVSGDTLTFSLFSKTSAVVAGNGINVTQTAGNYDVSVKLANNCGLCSDSSGLYVNSAIAGTGLNYSTGVLSVCGANLAGNSILWSGNTFNVNPSTGTLNTVLNTKLNTSVYQSYTGTTATAISCRLLSSIFNGYSGTTAPAQFIARTLFDSYTGTTAPAQFIAHSLFDSYTGATKIILDNKAFLSGATFSGIVRTPKAAQNDNSTCVATTSWYISQGATVNPTMDGVAACGISNLFARQDHVHPIDTSRLAVTVFGTYTGTTAPNIYTPKASPVFTGTVTMPTPFTLGAVSVVATGTVMNYLTGATSNIQSQINLKSNIASPTFTGTVTIPTPFTLGAVSVVSTGTVINYLTGATSNIQSQLNAKAPIISPTFTVSARSVTPAINDNNTCIATTAWYFGQGATSNPLMDGIATSGNSTCWSRQNHVHPTDTSRLATTVFNGYTGTTAPAAFASKSVFNTYTGTTAPAAFASKSVFNSYTGATQTKLSQKAFLSGATFTGTVTMPTPFTLGAVSVVSTGTVINYLTGATSNIQTQINTKTDKTKTIVTLTGNTTLNATYADKLIEANGTFTITLPDGMVTGMRLDIINVGAGAITLAATTTLNTKAGNKRLVTQWVGASAYHRGSNVWVAVGDLTA